MVIAKAHKPHRATQVGLTLWASPDRRRIIVVHVDEWCIFPRSHMTIGMQIISINGKNCLGKSVSRVNRYLYKVKGDLTVIATLPGSLLPCPTSQIGKDNRFSKLQPEMYPTRTAAPVSTAATATVRVEIEQPGESMDNMNIIVKSASHSHEEDQESDYVDSTDYGYEVFVPSGKFPTSRRRQRMIPKKRK